MNVYGITAMTPNGVIGNNDENTGEYKIPWHIPKDFEFFKKITDNNYVLMGRKTWDSLPKKFKPLPNRGNIVVTRNPKKIGDIDGVIVLEDPDEINSVLLDQGRNLFIIGGSEIYKHFLPRMDGLYVSEVHKEYEGNVKFPIPHYKNFFDDCEIRLEEEDFTVKYYY